MSILTDHSSSIFSDKQTLPNVLSVIFHPLWMPVAGTLFILFFSGMYITMLPMQTKQIILMVVGLCTLALPVALLLFYWIHYRISDIYISERKERIAPLIFIALFYSIAYWVLHSMHTPYVIQKFVLASTVAVFMTSVISLQWKISVHGVGIGGITGMLASLTLLSPALLPILSGSIIIMGIVGYARIKLNAHTPAQYYAGTLLGLIITLGIFFMY